MHAQTQFSVFLINKPGVLATVTEALGRAKVNVVALTLMDSMEHGVLRIVCHDPETARQVLGKAHDSWTETEVLLIELENNPGAFARVAKRLADEHINISYAYCTSGAHGGKTSAVFKVADLGKAKRVLSSSASSKNEKAGRTVKTPTGRKGKA